MTMLPSLRHRIAPLLVALPLLGACATSKSPGNDPFASFVPAKSQTWSQYRTEAPEQGTGVVTVFERCLSADADFAPPELRGRCFTRRCRRDGNAETCDAGEGADVAAFLDAWELAHRERREAESAGQRRACLASGELPQCVEWVNGRGSAERIQAVDEVCREKRLFRCDRRRERSRVDYMGFACRATGEERVLCEASDDGWYRSVAIHRRQHTSSQTTRSTEN